MRSYNFRSNDISMTSIFFREEILRALNFVKAGIAGAGSVLPLIDAEKYVKVVDSQVEFSRFRYVADPNETGECVVMMGISSEFQNIWVREGGFTGRPEHWVSASCPGPAPRTHDERMYSIGPNKSWAKEFLWFSIWGTGSSSFLGLSLSGSCIYPMCIT